ncbi:MAG: hypothetical protein FJ288_12680 [Planctomycetes bacterium]|nr:hypothetical protein [Planctomycetota bacterium]
MRRNPGVACLAGALLGTLAMLAGCAQPRGDAKAAPQAQPVDGWAVVYTGDFKGTGKLPPDWQVISGEARIEAGALLLTGPADGEGQLVLLAPRMPGSVRLECVASLKGDPISDISPFLSADTSGYASGYLFQFGGKANTLTYLNRYDEPVDSTVKNKPLVKPGQKHRILAENDGGRLRMVIDGQEIFRYADPQPLKGQGHDRIGFYTWGCTLVIDKLSVSAKAAQGAGK